MNFRSMVASLTASGMVDGPLSDIDMNATYTFEAEIDGRWYRWTDQRPQPYGDDRFIFHLRDGKPIDRPTNEKASS